MTRYCWSDVAIHFPLIQTVKVIGSDQPIPSPSLSSVLYISYIRFSWCQSAKLFTLSKLFSNLDPFSCYFQDLLTKNTIGGGCEHVGLYYLYDFHVSTTNQKDFIPVNPLLSTTSITGELEETCFSLGFVFLRIWVVSIRQTPLGYSSVDK